MPRSCGLMRASGDTALASVKMRESPPTAREPRWTRCQSLAKPSGAEYSHMGETAMRLRRRTSPICNSSNRFMSGDSLENFLDSATAWTEKSVVAFVSFKVGAIGYGIDEADDVFAGSRIEAVHEDGVGGVGVADEFEFGIVEDHVAIILDAEGAAYLKDDFCFVGIGFHDGSWYERIF